MRRDFVANVSHELKTPIGALGLLAETMAATDDSTSCSSSPIASCARPIAWRGSSTTSSTSQQIEAQEAPNRASRSRCRLLVAEAVDHVQAAADTAGVPLQHLPEPPEVEITCDHRQMRSALVNLLDNAIKYSEPDEAGRGRRATRR